MNQLLSESDDETTDWLVDHRLPIGGLGLLAGKPKTGKSTMARCLALDVARGRPWLGFKTTPGPVIYLGLEEKKEEVRAHFRALGARGEDAILLLFGAAPREALGWLQGEVTNHKPLLVIIDPLFRLVRVTDVNDYAVITTALEPYQTLARASGACVLLVHHLGKSERSDSGDSVLGSTAIFSAVDSALLLKRTPRYRTLSSIQRYGDDLDEMTITLDPITRDISAGASREELDRAEAKQTLLDYLKSIPRPGMTEAELDEVIEGRRGTWKKALRELVKDKQVVRTGEGGKADPFRYSGSGSPPYSREPENGSRARGEP